MEQEVTPPVTDRRRSPAAWLPDPDVVEPLMRPNAFTPRACWLYRIRDADGVLLYVGITRMGRDRIVAHCRKSWGWRISDVQWVRFDERCDAQYAEALAIAEERPLFNKLANLVQIRMGA